MGNNIFLDKSNWVRIPASQVKQGMMVTSLDRPWLETPFLLQGFVVRSESEIRKLQELCNHVFVEKEGRLWGDKKNPFKQRFGAGKRPVLGGDSSGLKARDRRKDEPSLSATLKTRTEHKVSAEIAQEHEVARQTYKKTKSVVGDILEQARLGNALDTKSAQQTVKTCVSSILRNPDALMWIAKIKHADEYTLEHCLNVCVLAIAFGRHLRLDEKMLEQLGICGLLHDVGKMQVDNDILNKPGRLTEDELEVMRDHTTRGRDLLLKDREALSYSIDAAMNHHERMDGKGYPRGLYAAELSNYARIISIVDAFDAMTSERCYSEAKSTLDALKEIFRERGKQFDEALALEFIQLIGPYPPGTLVKLRNGCVGVVLSSELKKRHLPTIKMVLNESGQEVDSYLINLLDVEKGTLPKDCLISRVLKDGAQGISLDNIKVSSDLAFVARKVETLEDGDNNAEAKPEDETTPE